MAYNPTGGDTADLDLDYVNRGKDWLCGYRPWDFLIHYINLTVDDTRIVDLPTDLQAIMEVYVDINNDGKPDLWFYANSPEVMQRYTLLNNYDPTLGASWQIKFPPNAYLYTSPTVKYIQKVDDYTGAASELSFFPAELLLRTAQKLYLEDRGIADTKAELILKSHAELIRAFEQMFQYQNQDMDLTVKNRYGVPIRVQGQPLDGSNQKIGYSPYLPAASFASWPY